ncbi:hypothetical protein EI94DRAFT_1705049 [Lactarius quietus]|nr:hypothetical protein EI94DRAFT_1705049 [Lactarius quietus]
MPWARDVIVPNAVPGIEEAVVKHTRTKMGRTRTTEKVVPVILPSLAASSKSKKVSRDKVKPIVQESERAIPTQGLTEHAEEHEYPDEHEYGRPEFTTQDSQPQAMSLGFFLSLGHGGSPCPKTVEGIKATQVSRSSWKGRKDKHAQLTSLRSVPEEDADALRSSGQLPMPGKLPNQSLDRQTQLSWTPYLILQIWMLMTQAMAVLEDFLTDNLECKMTAQQYYSKLQMMTNKMFPNNVPNRYKQLLRASRQWWDLKNRMESGVGHMKEEETMSDGSMAIFCPACPQPGINLPDDWKTRYTCDELIRTFIMDGNFSAEHMRHQSGERDVSLSAGMAFMANPDTYKAHLQSGWEYTQ